MVNKNFPVLVKFRLTSISSQNLDGTLAWPAKFWELLVCSDSRENLLDFLKFPKIV